MKSRIIKLLLPFLSFVILLFLPLIKSIRFEKKYFLFGNIPYFLIITLSFSLFISWIILFYNKNIKDINTDKPIFVVVLLYFLVFSILSILKHISFFSTGYDLGYYNQGMWGLINGILATSVGEAPLFGYHLEPILFLIAPFYLIYPSPITLVIIQTFFIAAAALPLYLLAKEKLKNRLASLVIAVSYLFYLPLWYANLFDFHPVVLAIPFIMFAIYFLTRKKYIAFLLSMILAAASKEHLSLLFIPFGVYLFIKHKKRALAIVTAVLGLIWFVFSINVIIPYFIQEPFLPSGYYFFGDNPVLGNSILDVIKSILLDPFLLVRELLAFNRLAYLSLLLIPMGFGVFAVIAPEFLFLGVTEFLIVLLHNVNTLPEIVYHHQITLVPFVLSASVVGILRLTKFTKNLKFKYVNKKNILYACSVFLLLTSISSNIVYGPFSVLYDLKNFDINNDYVKTGHRVVAMVPPDASIAAPNWIVPHLSERENIFMLDRFVKKSDYIKIYGDPEYIILDFSDALNDPKRSAKKVNLDSYNNVLNNPNYGVIYHEGSWVLLKHN